MEQATVTNTNRRLVRGEGPLGGVAAGMADYFGVDPTIVRLGLVATTLLGGPTIPIAYLAGWIIIPSAESQPTPTTPSASWAASPPPPVPPAPAQSAPAQPVTTEAMPAPLAETGSATGTVMVADTVTENDPDAIIETDTTDEESDK